MKGTSLQVSDGVYRNAIGKTSATRKNGCEANDLRLGILNAAQTKVCATTSS